MKHFIIICFSLFLFNCGNNPEEQLQYLNGYWEIKEATSNNITKTYKYNEFIDFITLNDSLKGFKKKLKPTFDGTFLKTNVEEALSVKVEDNRIILNYTSNFNTRKETVLKLTEDELKIKNEADQIYLYKRYQPLELN